MASLSTNLSNLYKKNERKIANFEYFKHYHCHSIVFLLTSSWLYFADNLSKTLLSFLLLTIPFRLVFLLSKIYRWMPSKIYSPWFFFKFLFMLSLLKSHTSRLKEFFKVLLHLIILSFFYHVVTFGCYHFIGKINFKCLYTSFISFFLWYFFELNLKAAFFTLCYYFKQ